MPYSVLLFPFTCKTIPIFLIFLKSPNLYTV
jgi:hypothetical protein